MNFSKMSLTEIRDWFAKEGFSPDDGQRAALSQDARAGVKSLYNKFCRREALLVKEMLRLETMQLYEKDARLQGYNLLAGVDEAGRGPLAGPVVAAAVILPDHVDILGINDSKKLNPIRRQQLYNEVTAKAICWSCGMATVEEIDSLNILRASLLAMQRAVMTLTENPDFILVDAVKIPGTDIPQLPIVKGDGLSVSIAAASIIAKVTRDRIMDKIDREFPQYGFTKHKGYGTVEHMEALRDYGACPIHRKTFTYSLSPETSSKSIRY